MVRAARLDRIFRIKTRKDLIRNALRRRREQWHRQMAAGQGGGENRHVTHVLVNHEVAELPALDPVRR